MPAPDSEDFWVDHNGCVTEHRWLGGQQVIVHYDDMPESDFTVRKGIRVTTPLRTVIDLAADVSHDELQRMISDCLERGLFTIEEAIARINQVDIRDRRGAQLVRRALLG